jgi:CRISP-associated protein Cas1
MNLLGVHSLHALAYCERLFYLENVELIRLADARVYAGRTLHVEIAREEEGEWHSLDLQSESLGLRGRIDCLRRRDGSYIPYEHKRGRAARTRDGEGSPTGARGPASGSTSKLGAACTWPSDRLQVAAYAMLIEEHTGQQIPEARVRYHQDNVTVRVPIDAAARQDVLSAIARARELSAWVERPPVTTNENLCVKCSLAPVCLPEEARRAVSFTDAASEAIKVGSTRGSSSETGDYSGVDELLDSQIEDDDISPAAPPGAVSELNALAPLSTERPSQQPLLRLFPEDDRRQSLHVVTPGARVGRSGDQLEITAKDQPKQRYPVREVGQVVLHGFAQITTQALRLCADKDVSVHWVTQGGSYVGAFSSGSGGVQKRIRQYEALRDTAVCLRLTRRLAEARILSQLRFLLRASRDRDRVSTGVGASIEGIRSLMPALKRAAGADEIRGVEGRAAVHYFAALPGLIDDSIDERMRPKGRSRRPPRDRFNALIGFGYGLLLKDVMSAILVVGLDPSFGFYHRPRSQAHPLALDLMELFRVPLVDLPVVASINRRQWSADDDFSIAGEQVWLSDDGRKKFIEVYERRKTDVWRHPALGYSLSYSRLVELEARLLEKEWTGEPGLFARMRLR